MQSTCYIAVHVLMYTYDGDQVNRIYLLFIVAILLTGCADSTFTPTPTLPPTAVTPNPLPEPSDPTQLVTAKAGERFRLVLPANESTGYHWEIIPELDPNIVEFVNREYLPEQPILAGSGGVDVWSFRAVNAGDTAITLGYFPPGSDANPDETVIFSIHIE